MKPVDAGSARNGAVGTVDVDIDIVPAVPAPVVPFPNAKPAAAPMSAGRILYLLLAWLEDRAGSIFGMLLKARLGVGRRTNQPEEIDAP